MILVSTTCAGPSDPVDRFVQVNLAHGADHVVVFLDPPDPRLAARLRGRDHVTTVSSDDAWWHGARPVSAQRRWIIHANAATVLGRDFEWVFGLRVDEAVCLDREALAAVPARVRSLHLAPLEALPRARWDGDPFLFKRLLTTGELSLLRTLGMLHRGDNRAWFRGPVVGRVGVRPGSRLGVGPHRVVRPSGASFTPRRVDGAHVLGFGIASGDEFVRAVAAGTAARPGQQSLAAALRAVAGLDVDEAAREQVLRRLFERVAIEREEDLQRLHLLEEVHVDRPTHRPRAMSRRERKAIARRLVEVAAADKRRFGPRAVGTVRREAAATGPSALRRAARRLR